MRFYKTPSTLRWLFYDCIWKVNTAEKNIYLTFDDGPTPKVTPWVLDLLHSNAAKATFFCIGKNITAYPELALRIINEGHTIANHTHKHPNGWKTRIEAYIESVTDCQNAIKAAYYKGDSIMPTTKLFRPPYGKVTLKQKKALQTLGFKIVMWDILSYDWLHQLDTKVALSKIMQGVSNGSILVFHDSVKAENNLKALLPKVIERLQSEGYTFKAL